MHNGDNDAPNLSAVVNDTNIVVAATLAAIVIAGSAYAYRARQHLTHPVHTDTPKSISAGPPTSLSEDAGDVTNLPADIPDAPDSFPASQDQDVKDAKRSKDRRRRGKDPVKELLKNGKKLKALSLTPSKSPSPSNAVDELDVPDFALRTPLSQDFDRGSASPARTPRGSSHTTTRSVRNSPLPVPRHTAPSGTTSVSHSRNISEVSQSNQEDSQSADDQNPHPSDVSSSASVVDDDEPRSLPPSAHRPALQENDLETDIGDDSHIPVDIPHSGIQAQHATTPPPSHLQPLPSPSASVSSSSAAMTTATNFSTTPATSPALSHSSTKLSSQPAASSSATLSDEMTAATIITPSLKSKKKRTKNTLSSSAMPALAAPAAGATTSDAGWEWDGMDRQLASYPSSSTVVASATPISPPSTRSRSPVPLSTTSNGGPSFSAVAVTAPSSAKSPGKKKNKKSKNGSRDNTMDLTSNDDERHHKDDNDHENNDDTPNLHPPSSARPSSSAHPPKPTLMAASSSQPAPSLSQPSPAASLYPPSMSTSVSADASLGGGAGPASSSLSSPLVDVPEQEEDGHEREEEDIVFPTLNPPPTSLASSSAPQRTTTVSNNNVSSPRRAPTPRRPPTPSRNTPSPHSHNSSHQHSRSNSISNSGQTSSSTSTNSAASPAAAASAAGTTGQSANANGNGNGGTATPALSAQTQLASLRGALEAARQREEKNKAELEKVMKEVEVLKWENMTWRRGEAEHQAHIRQLTHQINTYASYFAMSVPHSAGAVAQLQQAQAQAQSQAHPTLPLPPHTHSHPHQEQEATTGTTPQSSDINSSSSATPSGSNLPGSAGASSDAPGSSEPGPGLTAIPSSAPDGYGASAVEDSSGTRQGLSESAEEVTENGSGSASTGVDGASVESGTTPAPAPASTTGGDPTSGDSAPAGIPPVPALPLHLQFFQQLPPLPHSTTTSTNILSTSATSPSSPQVPTALHPFPLPHPASPFFGYPFLPAHPHHALQPHPHPHMMHPGYHPHPMSPVLGMPTSPTSPSIPQYVGAFGMSMSMMSPHPGLQYQQQLYQQQQARPPSAASASASASSNGSGPPSAGSMSPDLRGPSTGSAQSVSVNGNGLGGSKRRRKGSRQHARAGSGGRSSSGRNPNLVLAPSSSSTTTTSSSPSSSSLGFVPSTIGEDDEEDDEQALGLKTTAATTLGTGLDRYQHRPRQGSNGFADDNERNASEDENDDYEQDGARVNGFLVDAIFKRPGSIRRMSGSSSKGARDGVSGSAGGMNGRTPSRSGSASGSTGSASGSTSEREEPEVLTEFVFPSLSDIGNVKRATQGYSGTANTTTAIAHVGDNGSAPGLNGTGGLSPPLASSLPVVDEEQASEARNDEAVAGSLNGDKTVPSPSLVAQARGTGQNHSGPISGQLSSSVPLSTA